jgi:hypothetical protein
MISKRNKSLAPSKHHLNSSLKDSLTLSNPTRNRSLRIKSPALSKHPSNQRRRRTSHSQQHKLQPTNNLKAKVLHSSILTMSNKRNKSLTLSRNHLSSSLALPKMPHSSSSNNRSHSLPNHKGKHHLPRLSLKSQFKHHRWILNRRQLKTKCERKLKKEMLL